MAELAIEVPFPMWRAVILLIGVGTAIGCPSQSADRSTSENVLPLAGQNVEIVAPADWKLPARWEVFIQEWSSQTGVTVSWNEYKPPLVPAGLTAPPSGGRVFIIPFENVPLLDELRLISRLPVTVTEPTDLFAGVRERVFYRHRQPMFVPIKVPSLVVGYRRDLLEVAGRTVPRTWEEYDQLASEVSTWAPGLGVMEPVGPGHEATWLFARAVPAAKHPSNLSVFLDIDSGRPLLAEPPFLESLTAAVAHASQLNPKSRNASPTNCFEALLTGEAALAIGYFDETEPGTRERTGKLGFAMLPASQKVYDVTRKAWMPVAERNLDVRPQAVGPGAWGLSAQGGTGKLPEDSASSQLVALLAGSLFEQAFGANERSLCRESQLDLASRWCPADLTAVEAGDYIDTIGQSLRNNGVLATNPFVGGEGLLDLTSQAVKRTLDEGVSPETELKSVVEKWEDVSKQWGTEVVRDSYRDGLGLRPISRAPRDDLSGR
jgi:ABC-type glycerol-3-phosphate transport system substrate-binding protein